MHRILISVLCLLLAASVVSAQLENEGTPLFLGAGQELRIDLPLQAGNLYDIKLELAGSLENSVVTVSLVAISGGNEAAEYQRVACLLTAAEGWREIALQAEKIPQGPLRWELLLTADQEGRYFWRNLSVAKQAKSSGTIQEYWSEKLAREGTFYTGLVVDARHLELRRGMSPRIYCESGKLIYGGVLASEDLLMELGVVGYGSELTPELLKRLEVDPDYPYAAPLTVKAIGVQGAAKTAVCISEEDTRRVLEAMAKYDFFARYAVIFLL